MKINTITIRLRMWMCCYIDQIIVIISYSRFSHKQRSRVHQLHPNGVIIKYIFKC